MNARRPLLLVGASSAWMALVGNLPLWRELGALGLLQGPQGWLLALALAGITAAVLAAGLSLFAWRGSLKPVLVALLLATAAACLLMWRYHVAIDSSMLVNVLQTDWHESTALVDPGLVAGVAALGVLPAWLVWRYPVRTAPWLRQAGRNLAAAACGILLAALLLVLAFQPLASAMRNHKQLRYLMNPLALLYAGGQLAFHTPRSGPAQLQPLGRDARAALPAGRPPLLVLVVGETARADHFGLNGYARPTTPELQAQGVASFTQAWACGTSTAASLPCMFSHLGREAFGARTGDHENLLDVLDHAGLAVLWLDNQSGCKGVCERIAHQDTARTDQALCEGGECQDGVLLQGLQARLDALPAERRARGVVLVLHQMGSHGPAYWKRSPAAFKRFQPECRSINLQDCTQQELVNAYDNSIASTDHMLAGTIAWLRAQQAHDTALLYVSDHGESLGEGSLYLHGLPWSIAPDVQKHVPWITWLSPQFERSSGTSITCVQQRAQLPVSHDNLFHSVLGLMQVQTSAYRRELDVYAGCAPH